MTSVQNLVLFKIMKPLNEEHNRGQVTGNGFNTPLDVFDNRKKTSVQINKKIEKKNVHSHKQFVP